MAPGRGTGLRTGALVPFARWLLQRQQTAGLHVRQGERNAQSPRLERLADADAHHRPVPSRSEALPVENAGHAYDGQMPTALGSTRFEPFY